MMNINVETYQTDPSHGPNLILDVKNFGPIAEAQYIEFTPMTVFVGPSNTGKTYLAMLLHAILKANKDRSGGPLSFQQDALRFRLDDKLIDYFIEDVDKEARLFYEMNNNSDEISERPSISLKTEVEFQSFVNRNVNLYCRSVEQSINELFDIVSFHDLSNSDKMIPSVVLTSSEHLKMYVSLGNRDNTLSTISDDLPITERLMEYIYTTQYLANPSNYNPREKMNNSREVMREVIQHILSSGNKLFSIFPHSVYFPTGRTGIMNGHRILTSSIIANASRFGIEERDSSTYNLLARDFLRLLIELRENPIRHRYSFGGAGSYGSKIAEVIEQSIIKGNIRVEDSIGLNDFEFERNGVVTPMFRASSMVTELAPIVMFLRNHIGPKDLLIIDEPEAHLHPAAQQQMAAALAFMVRSGLRVLITTHSHYMVEQIGNFVTASTLDEDVRREVLGLPGPLGEQDVFLNEDEVSVYDFQFDDSKDGSIVFHVEYKNDDFGYFPQDHNWAIVDQMNRTQRVIEARIDQDERTASI